MANFTPHRKWLGPPAKSGELLRYAWHELLADDEWHDYTRTIIALSIKVPHGKAERRLERDREVWASNHGRPLNPRTDRTPDHRLKDYGANIYARAAVASRVWFEVDPPGRVGQGVRKRIRRRTYPKPQGEQ